MLEKENNESKIIFWIGIAALVIGLIVSVWTFGSVAAIGALFAIIGGICWAYNSSRIKENTEIALRGILAAGFVTDANAKEQILPLMGAGIMGFISQTKCMIQYTFYINGQEHTYKLKCPPETHDYLIDVFDLIVAYDEQNDKLVLISLIKK